MASEHDKLGAENRDAPISSPTDHSFQVNGNTAGFNYAPVYKFVVVVVIIMLLLSWPFIYHRYFEGHIRRESGAANSLATTTY